LIQQHQARGTSIPDHLWIPIRDPEKQPTPAERDALRANQSLYDAVETAQAEWDRVHSENPLVFTDIPIDPAILEAERQFQIQQTPGLHIDVEEEGSGTDGEGGSGTDGEGGSGTDGEGGSDLASTPRSVISIDSIAENADFVSLE
jgi:hypothetical protein